MRFVFISILGLMASCKPSTPPMHSKILNIDSLLSAQVNVNRIVTLEKTFQVNDSTFTSIVNTGLQNELSAFQEVDQVNRLIYRDQYKIAVFPDTQSNLTVKSWIAQKDVPLKSLKLFYLDKIDRLKRLEAEFLTEELYAQSTKKFVLNFNILGDTVRLENMSISGSQRYFWSSARYFSINAVIRR